MTMRPSTSPKTSFGLRFGAPVTSTVASQHNTDRAAYSSRRFITSF